MKFAVLAEDKSDVEALRILVRRLSGIPSLSVTGKGFEGCAKLRRKLASHMRNFARDGVSHFIVCHDSDFNQPQSVKAQIEAIIKAGCASISKYSIIVPVQEIEAWVIADEVAIRKVIQTMRIKAVLHPERIDSPKQWLEKTSRVAGTRPRYEHTIHNHIVFSNADLNKIAERCPSFRPLKEFVRSSFTSRS